MITGFSDSAPEHVVLGATFVRCGVVQELIYRFRKPVFLPDTIIWEREGHFLLCLQEKTMCCSIHKREW